MKALTVKQPWASLIVHGFKDVENRARPTTYRGPFLIHAGKARDKAAFELASKICKKLGIYCPTMDEIEHWGMLVGGVTLADDVTDSKSPWAFKKHRHYILKGAWMCRPTPWAGNMSFFEVPTPPQSIQSANRP